MPAASKKEQFSLLAVLFLNFFVVVSVVSYFGSDLFGFVLNVTRPAPAPVIDRRPIVPEDAASASQPLSKVLDLDFIKNGQSYVTFDHVVRSRLRKRQFNDLDVFAGQLRESKSRMPAGGWRLFRLYSQINEPTDGPDVTDAEWQAHLSLLREWIRAMPESITARVAYGESLIKYGWHIRTDRYSKDVSEEQWDGFFENLERARLVLDDARNLSARCPHWYAAMLTLAKGQEWDRDGYNDLFEDAVEFEPLYRSYYYQTVEYLLPRWYGRPGESEKFLQDATDRIGGAEGSSLYYFTFISLRGYYTQDDVFDSNVRAAWARLKQGYRDTDNLYKLTNRDVTVHARMAYIAGDKTEARMAFERLGDNLVQHVWESTEQLESAKAWALTSE